MITIMTHLGRVWGSWESCGKGKSVPQGHCPLSTPLSKRETDVATQTRATLLQSEEALISEAQDQGDIREVASKVELVRAESSALLESLGTGGDVGCQQVVDTPQSEGMPTCSNLPDMLQQCIND